MTSINSNRAALLTGQNQPLAVGPGPDQSTPSDGEIVVQVAAVAINPSEWKMQDYMYLPLQLPHVMGSDFAGTVVKIGAGVSRVKPGDRVIGHCVGLVQGGARHGSFQNFTTVLESVIAKIPASLSFEQASVLPLGVSTSACGLFEVLGLKPPSPTGNASEASQVVVIWGGASSMGTVGIQLALAAGYKVVTTVSPKNNEFIQSLSIPEDGQGSITIFDSYSTTTGSDIINHIKISGLQLAAVYDPISSSSTILAGAQIQHELRKNGKIATVLPLMDESVKLPVGVKAEMVFATNPALVPDHVGLEIWKMFVPEALANGRLKALPKTEIVGHGLEYIQKALDIQKAGVSARKIVVTL